MTTTTYSAKDITVLEGLEPVRRRPGMYIGGTDEKAMHHLFAEVIDNSMDEAVAGHANRIEVELHADYSVTIRDNGRGIFDAIGETFQISEPSSDQRSTSSATPSSKPGRPVAVRATTCAWP